MIDLPNQKGKRSRCYIQQIFI